MADVVLIYSSELSFLLPVTALHPIIWVHVRCVLSWHLSHLLINFNQSTLIKPKILINTRVPSHFINKLISY